MSRNVATFRNVQRGIAISIKRMIISYISTGILVGMDGLDILVKCMQKILIYHYALCSDFFKRVIFIHTYIYIYIYLCMHIYIYIGIYSEEYNLFSFKGICSY